MAPFSIFMLHKHTKHGHSYTHAMSPALWRCSLPVTAQRQTQLAHAKLTKVQRHQMALYALSCAHLKRRATGWGLHWPRGLHLGTLQQWRSTNDVRVASALARRHSPWAGTLLCFIKDVDMNCLQTSIFCEASNEGHALSPIMMHGEKCPNIFSRGCLLYYTKSQIQCQPLEMQWQIC